ncbi:MAG TPA: GreA/GreB family elongation factor [Steroidobacteraceae bacterium]|nr:GreA/GreB family elongation factor [Steroidobacteraceae bacterium]
MSRAFVKESDGDPGALPERNISAHPNLVTPRGLAAIEARIQELTAERQAARTDEDTALSARVERDLRYWHARRASARVIEATAATERVRFGMRVTLQLAAGGRQQFRLVGEDEADAANGLISWVSPLGQTLLGKEAGDGVPYQGGEAEIVSIEP